MQQSYKLCVTEVVQTLTRENRTLQSLSLGNLNQTEHFFIPFFISLLFSALSVAFCEVFDTLASLLFVHPSLRSLCMESQENSERSEVGHRFASAVARSRVLETLTLTGRPRGGEDKEWKRDRGRRRLGEKFKVHLVWLSLFSSFAGYSFSVLQLNSIILNNTSLTSLSVSCGTPSNTYLLLLSISYDILC